MSSPSPTSVVDLVAVATDTVAPAVLAALEARLTAEEEARRRRLVRAGDRATFTITRALVRTTLSRHGPTAPGDWRFVTNAHGCPAIEGDQGGDPWLYFNLSHASDLAVVAVTRGHRVGVDVERVDRVVTHDIADRHFAESEAAALRARPESDRARTFFEYWTLKEAYIKARGMGLAIPLGDFAFTLRPPDPPTIAFVDGFDDDPARWQFWQAWATPWHRVSLAIEREGPDLAAALRLISPEALDR